LKATTYWQTNENIRASKLRVIDSSGNQLGVMSKADALKLKDKKGTDLVEIAPKANPPVAKLIDFGKFRYQEEKKAREQKKKTKAGEVKEIRFSPFIGEADYQTRMKRVRKLLDANNKIRAVVVFKGRQMNSKTFGYNLLSKITKELEGTISIDMEPKFLGRHLAMVISPLKKKIQKK